MMIPLEAIREFFPDAHTLGDGVTKFSLQVPAAKDSYYLKGYPEREEDILIVSTADEDDAFSMNIFNYVFDKAGTISPPTKLPLGFSNPYNYEIGLVVGPEYHGYLKGTLDGWRKRLYLCVPAYNCEFSGNESMDEFLYIWIYLMPHSLRRERVPKIKLCFSNPKTQTSTRGHFLIRSYRMLKTVIETLEAVPDGEVRLVNFLEEELKLTSDRPDQYLCELTGNRMLTDKASTLDAVDRFLTLGSSALE